MSSDDQSSLKNPPGPRGWPIIGSLASLISHKEKTLMQWAEENYGPVFALKMGSYKAIALQGYDAVHEAVVTKAQSFSGRMYGAAIDAARNNKGLFFKPYDDFWKKWRHFTQDGLKDVWKTTEDGIVEETKHLQDTLSELEGENDLTDLLYMSMANGVMQTCFSHRFDTDDAAFKDLFTKVYIDIKDPKFQATLLMPWLRHIPPFSGFLTNSRRTREAIVEKLLELVDERRAEDRNTADLTTFFYKDNPTPSPDDRESFAILVEDLIFAGSTTTSIQLLWVLVFLLTNPEAMNRVQSEMDTVLEDCESPVRTAITDRFSDLNFTRAVIEEAARLRPLAPTSLFHYATEDNSIMGYKVEKGTVVINNIWSVHHDKQKWAPDPEVFRPERHLDQSGTFRKSGHVIPFGIGWRRCPGQKLAETELLAYTVAIFMKFDVTLAKCDVDYVLTGESTAVLKPNDFKVSVKPRSPQ